MECIISCISMNKFRVGMYEEKNRNTMFNWIFTEIFMYLISWYYYGCIRPRYNYWLNTIVFNYVYNLPIPVFFKCNN